MKAFGRHVSPSMVNTQAELWVTVLTFEKKKKLEKKSRCAFLGCYNLNKYVLAATML